MNLEKALIKFSKQCGADLWDVDKTFLQFLTVQVKMVPWEKVYTCAIGNDCTTFKYKGSNGKGVANYTRDKQYQKFGAAIWRDIFKDASISDELKNGSNYEHRLAAFHGFCRKVIDPISKNLQNPMGEDKKLMLFYLLNLKNKNLREVIHDKSLQLDMPKNKIESLFNMMAKYEVEEEESLGLIQEIGLILKNTNFPCIKEGSELRFSLIQRLKENEHISSSSSSNGHKGYAAILESTNNNNKSSNNNNNKPKNTLVKSRATGWNDEKLLSIGQNTFVADVKKALRVPVMPPRESVAQSLVFVVSSDLNHWNVPSGFKIESNVGNRVKNQIVKFTGEDRKEVWRGMLKCMEYVDTEALSKTKEVQTFLGKLSEAKPKLKIDTCELLQKFITAHLPNWKSHWAAMWKQPIPKTVRAVTQYKAKNPNPSDEFIKTFVKIIKQK